MQKYTYYSSAGVHINNTGFYFYHVRNRPDLVCISRENAVTGETRITILEREIFDSLDESIADRTVLWCELDSICK